MNNKSAISIVVMLSVCFGFVCQSQGQRFRGQRRYIQPRQTPRAQPYRQPYQGQYPQQPQYQPSQQYFGQQNQPFQPFQPNGQPIQGQPVPIQPVPTATSPAALTPAHTTKKPVLNVPPTNASPIKVSVENRHWTQILSPEKRHHNFGVVPSFSDQQFEFEFENTLDQPIQLVGIRASCGCTKPFIVTKSVAPGATGKVLAKYDTRNFKGKKKATISVSVRKDTPYVEYGEIQFSVEGKIRRDVVLNPGTVAFDDITLGTGAKRTVQVLYAGSPKWKITGIKSTNPNIKIESKELQRIGNRVDYELSIQLDEDQDVGSFVDQIQIATNDVENKNLAVTVQGNVKSVVQVSPVKLGVVSKDQKVEKRLIVRGARPFGIRKVSVGDQRIQFTPSEGSKTLHILTYKLDTSAVGNIRSQIMIETDDPDQEFASVPFEVQVVPATFALDGANKGT